MKENVTFLGADFSVLGDKILCFAARFARAFSFRKNIF